MAIEEVPIEGSDTQASDAPEAAPVEAAPAAPAAPAVVARKRGRPKGVANKPKTVQVVEEVAIEPPKEAKEAKAVKTKPAPKKPKKVRVAAPSDSEDEPAPPPKRRKEMPPPPPDTRQIASEVLQLLSDRHVEKKHAQRQKYASWFQ